jgi:hypothetical protein
MVLYASYVCLLYSRFIENHPIDLAATNTSFLRRFCHTKYTISFIGALYPHCPHHHKPFIF